MSAKENAFDRMIKLIKKKRSMIFFKIKKLKYLQTNIELHFDTEYLVDFSRFSYIC